MSEPNVPIKDYDAKHGTYKSDAATDVNTASSAIPAHEAPKPYALHKGESEPVK